MDLLVCILGWFFVDLFQDKSKSAPSGNGMSNAYMAGAATFDESNEPENLSHEKFSNDPFLNDSYNDVHNDW